MRRDVIAAILFIVLAYLKSLSGFSFSLLGASFFAAWILLRNKLWMEEATLLLQVADLPLVFCAVVYGGLSLYLSVQDHENPSRLLPLIIAIPLAAFFGLMLVMNFWG